MGRKARITSPCSHDHLSNPLLLLLIPTRMCKKPFLGQLQTVMPPTKPISHLGALRLYIVVVLCKFCGMYNCTKITIIIFIARYCCCTIIISDKKLNIFTKMVEITACKICTVVLTVLSAIM